MLIIHGSDDAVVPVEQSRALANALDAAGVANRLIVIQNARHGFEFRFDDQRDLIVDIIDFLDNAWGGGRRPIPNGALGG